MLSCLQKEYSNWLYYSPVKNTPIYWTLLFTKHCFQSWRNSSEKKRNSVTSIMEQSWVRSCNINSGSFCLSPSYVAPYSWLFSWGCGFRTREDEVANAKGWKQSTLLRTYPVLCASLYCAHRCCVFTNWRQDTPLAKKMTTRFIATLVLLWWSGTDPALSLTYDGIQRFLFWDPLLLFFFPSALWLLEAILLSYLTGQRKGKDA